MPDRDAEVAVLLRDAAAPRPLPDELRADLVTALRDEADGRLAVLLQDGAGPRPLDPATRSALRDRLGDRAGRHVLGGGRSGRLTVALLSAAAAVLLLVGTAVVLLRPTGEVGPLGPVAQPAPSRSSAAPAGGALPTPLATPSTTPPRPPVPAAPVASGGTNVSAPERPASLGSPSPSPEPEPRPGGPAAPGAPADPGGGSAPQRRVSDVEPDAGPLSGGTAITIYGSGLSSAVRVEVAGRVASGLRVESDSRLTARTPPGARTGQATVVVVMADGGRYGLSPGFTYVARPVLTAVSPETGRTSGGNVVTLSGEHFRRDSAVRFGGVLAEVLQVSDTSIEVVAPAHPAGPVDVTVTTPGGTSTARRYTYLPG